VLRTFADRRAVLPIDSASGGSWIAVNDAGLVMVIVNRNPGGMPVKSAPLSRGAILPLLLHCDSLRAAERLALDLNGAGFAPFRLILATRTEASVVVSGGGVMPAAQHLAIKGPLLFTSSGLGDALVEGPRRRLFEQMCKEPAWRPEEQDSFHRHSWPRATQLSVCMRRPDACTVSHTIVELGRDTATLTYLPHAPDEPGPSVALHLPLATKECT
jgi:hypothetical protein